MRLIASVSCFVGATLLLVGGTAAAQEERYTFEPGFDRPGAVYETFEQTSDYQSHVLCRDACYSQPRCKAYTYAKPGVDGPKAFCRLKDSVPAPVEDYCCISAVKGGKPKQAAVSSVQLQWLGWDADKVGKAPAADKPDGAPDHRFTLQVRLPSPQEVLSVSLVDPADGSRRWSNSGAGAEYLAVEYAGRRLNTEGPTLGKREGTVVFDLYAHDVGQWDVGYTVVVEVKLAGGRIIAHAFELKPPPDQLLGLWQMFCDPKSPDAFEPMTISGRLQLVLHENNTITGYFGRLPLTGELAPSGAVSGKAEFGGDRVAWKGKLEKVKRGQPLRGSGSFQFEQVASGSCVGPGSWSAR